MASFLALTRNGKPETLDAWRDAEDVRLGAEAHAQWVAAGRPGRMTLEE